MTLGNKFTNTDNFIKYVKDTFGITLDRSKAYDFFITNTNVNFSYTGVLKLLKSM